MMPAIMMDVVAGIRLAVGVAWVVLVPAIPGWDKGSVTRSMTPEIRCHTTHQLPPCCDRCHWIRPRRLLRDVGAGYWIGEVISACD